MFLLEGRHAQVLEKLNTLCQDRGYKIVDTADILYDDTADADGVHTTVQSTSHTSIGVPTYGVTENYLTAQEIKESIFFLNEQNYIDLKYHNVDRGVYCIAVLDKGRLYRGQDGQSEEERNAQKVHPCPHLQSFYLLLSAFFGGVLGGTLVAVIVMVIAMRS